MLYWCFIFFSRSRIAVVRWSILCSVTATVNNFCSLFSQQNPKSYRRALVYGRKVKVLTTFCYYACYNTWLIIKCRIVHLHANTLQTIAYTRIVFQFTALPQGFRQVHVHSSSEPWWQEPCGQCCILNTMQEFAPNTLQGVLKNEAQVKNKGDMFRILPATSGRHRGDDVSFRTFTPGSSRWS